MNCKGVFVFKELKKIEKGVSLTTKGSKSHIMKVLN